MDSAVRDRVTYAFGPFRLDATRRVLTREGAPVALTPTVFDTLLHLVENPDRVVSKDELLDAIWPGRVVEESNISQTIFTLRKALGGEGDRFIVTAPGRGYRFAAPVRLEGHAPALDAPPSVSALVGRRGPWRRRSIGLAAVLVLVSVLAATGVAIALHPWRASSGPGARSLVVLAEFQNLTRDPIFDRTLGKVLEIDLDQSPFVAALPERQVRDTLVLMTRSGDERLTPPLAQEVCARDDGQAVVEGAIAALGAKYLLTLTATDCAGERVLASEKVQVDGREAVIPALDRLIRQVRGKLGESAGSIAKFDVSLARERTSSLAALKAFSEASHLAGHGQSADSIPLFQHAIELDPNFATAYASLSAIYYNLTQKESAIASITKAYALRDTVNEREKFHIITLYGVMVTQDVNETIRASEAWSETYPQDFRAWVDLANADNWIGRYPEAIGAAKRALAINPGAETAYIILARPLMHAGRLAEAAAICARAAAKGLDGEQIRGLMMEIAVAGGDHAGLERQVAWARGKPVERAVLIFAARDAYRQGQVRRGDDLYARVAELSKDQDLSDFTLAPRARDLTDLGLMDRARVLLDRVPADPDPENYLFTLADVGDPARVRTILDRYLRQAPSDTLLNAIFAPEARATLALRQGRPTEAVAALQPALPYEARDNDVPYLRGRAYLAAADGARAVAEFRKILDHPGVEPASPLYPLAQLGLARALRLEGDLPAGRRAYATFLASWKDADPDLPVLRAARAEYAAIERGAVRP